MLYYKCFQQKMFKGALLNYLWVGDIGQEVTNFSCTEGDLYIEKHLSDKKLSG